MKWTNCKTCWTFIYIGVWKNEVSLQSEIRFV